MYPTRFPREFSPIKGNVFIISPFGRKVVADGEESHDFDYVCREVIEPAVRSTGMTPVRADSIYGPPSVLETVWRGIQQAELVIVDFTGKAPNVALEFALAATIGKRMVFLTQDKADIPTDIQGVRYIPYGNDFKAMKEMSEQLVHHLEAAREEQAVELGFTPFGRGGSEPAPGQVFSVQREMAVIKTDDGRLGVLGQADCDWGRIIGDMGTRYKIGERVDGAFDTETMKYTLLAGQSNPWPTVESDYEVGARFPGIVQNKVAGVGAFVKVVGPVKGLVTEASSPEVAELERGDQVEVIVTRIDVANRKVQLRLARRMEAVNAPSTTRSSTESSGAASMRPAASGGLAVGDQIDDAEVVKVVREENNKGGFILVMLPGFGRAMIHCTEMTPDLRADMNSGEVERGELISVVVHRVDQARGRILVRDVPDLDNGTPDASKPAGAGSVAA